MTQNKTQATPKEIEWLKKRPSKGGTFSPQWAIEQTIAERLVRKGYLKILLTQIMGQPEYELTDKAMRVTENNKESD
jgi:hypothetical protein